MMRYRWSIWYLLPGSPVFWKPPSQTKWRSQRCHKLCIRKLSHMSRTVIKLSETVMSEGAFSSGALNFMQYQRLNSAQFYPVLFLFAIFPKLLLVQMQQGDLWKGWRKQQEKQGGGFHTGESGPANSDMSQHYRVSGLILIGPLVITVRVDYSIMHPTAGFALSFPARPGAEPFGILDEFSWTQHFKFSYLIFLIGSFWWNKQHGHHTVKLGVKLTGD